MKGNKTLKKTKQVHAVVVCSIIGRRGISCRRTPTEVKFKIDDNVHYLNDRSEVQSGVIVGIVADISKSDPNSNLTYKIKTGNKILPNVPFDNVYSDYIEAKLAAKGLREHKCVIEINNTCFFDTVYAKNEKDAISVLERKYPGATNITSLYKW